MKRKSSSSTISASEKLAAWLASDEARPEQKRRPGRRLRPAGQAKAEFLDRVKTVGKSECWEWQGGIGKDGYGVVWLLGAQFRAHRIAYLLENGGIPDGALICHHCDNPKCCNPSHLYAGTTVENRRDCIRRGRVRIPCGEERRDAKLTELAVREIRACKNFSAALLARQYGVSSSLIWAIKQRRTWRHV